MSQQLIVRSNAPDTSPNNFSSPICMHAPEVRSSSLRISDQCYAETCLALNRPRRQVVVCQCKDVSCTLNKPDGQFSTTQAAVWCRVRPWMIRSVAQSPFRMGF